MNYINVSSPSGGFAIDLPCKQLFTMADQYFNQQPHGSKNRVKNVAVVGVSNMQACSVITQK